MVALGSNVSKAIVSSFTASEETVMRLLGQSQSADGMSSLAFVLDTEKQ